MSKNDSDIFKKYETSTETEKKDEIVEDTDSEDETDADKSDKESDDKKSEDKTEAADKSEDKNSNTDKTQSSNTGNNSSNTGSKPVDTQDKTPSKPVEPTKPVHTHSYNATVTANASCTANGVKTYTCSCGDSYTESIPKIAHSWETQYKTVTEEIYHEGETTYVTACGCGKTFANDNEWNTHSFQMAALGEVNGHSCGTAEIQGQGWTETKNNTVACGQKCTVCGATQ